MTDDLATELARYSGWWRVQGRSESALAAYTHHVRKLVESTGVPVDDMTQLAIVQHLTAERARGLKPATVHTMARAYRSFFGWWAEETDTVSVAAKVKLPVVPESPDALIVSEADVIAATRRLFHPRFTTVRDRALIWVLWSTGVRRSELLNMRLADLDMANNRITLPRTKAGRVREVGLDDHAARWLARYLRKRSQHPHAELPWLWLGHRGRLGPSGARKIIVSRFAAVGVQVTPHAFRRGFAKNWLRKGGSQAGLQSMCGWSSGAMVVKYLRQDANEVALIEHQRIFG